MIDGTDGFFFFLTLQFYYKPRILDLRRGIIAIMHFSYLKFICMIVITLKKMQFRGICL